MKNGDLCSVVEALRKLAPEVKQSEDRAWRRVPALRVLDCVLSLNRRYCEFVVPRLNRFETKHPKVETVHHLSECINSFPSPTNFMLTQLNYNHGERADALDGVTKRLVNIAGRGAVAERLSILEKWAISASVEGYKDFNVRGFGICGYQYLRMLFGANTTKPDKWIRDWVADVLKRSVSALYALELIEAACKELGLNARDVDTTIWEKSVRGEFGCRGHGNSGRNC